MKSAVEIFALTGDVIVVSIASCMAAGMDVVLSKPLRLSDLHHCLSGQWQPVDVKAMAPPLRVAPSVRNELSTHLSSEKLTELFRRKLASLDTTMNELEAAAKHLDQPDSLDLALAKKCRIVTSRMGRNTLFSAANGVKLYPDCRSSCTLRRLLAVVGVTHPA